MTQLGQSVTATAEDGTVITLGQGSMYCVDDVGGYMRKDDGSPIQMFTKIGDEGYRKVKLTADIKDKDGKVLAAISGCIIRKMSRIQRMLPRVFIPSRICRWIRS